MDTNLKTSLWQQFGAAIDTLNDAINLCPDHLWTAVVWPDEEDARYGQFWFIAYHTLFWLDLFLTGSSEGFAPPAPFIRGALPDHPYTQDEVRAYLVQCRAKCRATIEGLTDERARQRCPFRWMEPTFLELQFYCMRHVMEHAGQLGYFLGQQGVAGIDWVSQAREEVA
ncbi:MAG: DinB family protein [Anaerolineae bacterium]|uniref:DinB family protein n=1 Tax=Promineifilum sp. TaxID=2664178 RepID=UPI001D6C9FF7|nr:DinB family protein [Anaerolineales bacterium]MCB8934403.1 DinB family protein [Promineifilum sp.]MCO5181751.1 DinB family protein [Promineifilum sp.]MCW5847365.1 DinB family protein [Anaerolineae bacterium]